MIETKSFNEWISNYSEQTQRFEKMVFELKNWTYEHYSDNPYSFMLKCKLCRNWCNDCKCFERLKK